jgi:uncharacterized membrane protein
MKNSLKILVIILLILGIFFRFFNLGEKVFWHDEVYTIFRATGYKSGEFYGQEFQNKLVTVEQIQAYQQLKSNSTAWDTVESLVLEDPQHPPLYFLMNRYWLKIFGSSIISNRILAIFISLLSVPAMYWLGRELFNSSLVGFLAALLLFFSPFEIIFAQIARQYSLLTLLIILSSFSLVRALKYNKIKDWGFYILWSVLGLYTHIFFILNTFANLGFVIINKKIARFSWVLLFILAIYSPWIIVFISRKDIAFNSTSWAKLEFNFLYFAKQWLLSFSAIFADLFFGFDNPLTYLYRLLFISLSIWAIYQIYKQTNWFIFSFILTILVIPFTLLLISDLVGGYSRSTVTRYLLSSFPALFLAVGYLFARYQHSRIYQGIFVVLLTNSLISGAMNAFADTSWVKVPSYHNKDITRIINQSNKPVILSDRGDSWTNIGDVVSLSYHLNPEVKFILASYPYEAKKLNKLIEVYKDNLFIYYPSQSLKSFLEENYGTLEPVKKEFNLWQIKT